MENSFDTLIDSYLLNKIGISDGFLSEKLSNDLRSNLIQLYDNQKLVDAKTGQGNQLISNTLIRKDKIFWLDKSHKNVVENTFFELMDKFVLFLNSTCYTGISSYEFHYALYEKGSFYKKHLDQFQNNSSRQYTIIFYFNKDWKEGDGGELRVYQNQTFSDISPINCKTVFFKSNELEHEVLETHKDRMSISGWFKVG